jgi:ketosteroid isomerase-like protein
VTPEELVEIDAIKRLKYRYVRLLDLKEWDELAKCFVEDATASYAGGEHSFEGRDAIMAFLQNSLGSTSILTSHKVHQPEIELLGPDAATAVWGLEDVVVHTEAGLTIRGAAFYEDRYVKTAEGWRIQHTGYRRVYEEVERRGAELKLRASWWDPQPGTTLPGG